MAEPPDVESVRVLRVRPGDRLAVTIPEAEFDQADPEQLTATRENIAAWAGLPRDAVIIVSGAELEVLRTEGTSDD